MAKKLKRTKDKLYRADFKDNVDKIKHILSCFYQRRREILKHSPFEEATFQWLGKTWFLTPKGFKVR